MVEDIHEKHPEMGYRRLKDELDRHHNTHINDKRMLRICRSRRIKSTIKYSNHGCTRQGKNPYYLADNLLNREFKADRPNQKWLTDVTEFKYYVGIEVKKVYLSAILDLYDRRIVSYATLPFREEVVTCAKADTTKSIAAKDSNKLLMVCFITV